MSKKTTISWCDSTLNFWEGCTKVSPGCAQCYAEARDKRFTGGKLWGRGALRRKSKSAVKDAVRLNSFPWICDECGQEHALLSQICLTPGCECETNHRRRIFSLSLGDWLDDEVPIEWLAEMLDTIRQCDRVVWILCSKRIDKWRKRLEEVQNYDFDNGNRFLCGWIHDWLEWTVIPKNICLLTSTENQAMVNNRILDLIKIPASWRGLSLEPLLESIDLNPDVYRLLDWLIIGGESGPHARPCNVDWIRSLVDQGAKLGVATFVKQLGTKPLNYSSPIPLLPQKDKKGGDFDKFPDELKVRQYPIGL